MEARFRRGETGSYFVSFPDLREAITDGRDMMEALSEAADCLGSVLSLRMSHKEDILPPSKPKRGQRLIPVPLWIAGKVALYTTMRAQAVSNVELARRLDVQETIVRRMLSPGSSTRPERLQAALAALGKQLVVDIQDAA